MKHPKLKTGLKDIPGMVNSAFTRVSQMKLSQSAFACTGIYPMNRNIFSELDFQVFFSRNLHLSAETPSPFSPARTSPSISNLNQISTLKSAESTQENPSSPAQVEVLTSMPSTSQALLEELSPLPNSSNANFTARRRQGAQSEILTSAPYKAQLEEKRSDLQSGDKKKVVNKGTKRKKEGRPVGKSASTIKKKVLKFNENNGQVASFAGSTSMKTGYSAMFVKVGLTKTVPILKVFLCFINVMFVCQSKQQH
ncbi:hypothetical protein PR048_027448 [Dryococelus australis]|uniref:Uncharacterized protein n=1 Tax=Dryococelus australis TaxID=614101 RepID=A0ABQ9GFM8_9NEOP|nr:hypothetical protein PR048_027448 [Dryococelus australis]